MGDAHGGEYSSGISEEEPRQREGHERMLEQGQQRG